MKTIAILKETRNIEAILQVKRNQPKLLSKCIELSQTGTARDQVSCTGKRERNRIEKRTVMVFRKGDYDLGDVWNDSIKVVIRVERETKIFNTKTKQFDMRGEIAFYISTTDMLSAKEFAAVIRSHWGIENTNHYVKDVSLHEDFSRIRKNPENIAVLRSFALNLLRRNHEPNISQALYHNAINVSRILNYVGVRN